MNMDANKEIEIVINRFKSGDYEFTINKVSVLLKKFPNNDMLWNLKGLSLQTIGNIKDSIQCFVKSLNINPKNIAAKNNLGNSYKYANQYNLALEGFEECIKKDPSYTAAIVNLANQIGFSFVRGSDHDVLSRFCLAAQKTKSNHQHHFSHEKDVFSMTSMNFH